MEEQNQQSVLQPEKPKKRFYKKWWFWFLVVIMCSWLTLLITSSGILINEKKVNPGDILIVEGYGNLGDSSQSSLVCSYFIGYKIIKEVFWYSPNDILGRSRCDIIN